MRCQEEAQWAIEGLQGMAGTQNSLPEVIITDPNMPILDGWDFLEDFGPLVQFSDVASTIYMMSSSFDPRDLERVKNYPIVPQYFRKRQPVLAGRSTAKGNKIACLAYPGTIILRGVPGP